MCRFQERFKRAVNFYAFDRRDLFGRVRELDIGSRLGFADDLSQVGGNCLQCSAVVAIVCNQGSLQIRSARLLPLATMNNALQAGCYRAIPFRTQIVADILEIGRASCRERV